MAWQLALGVSILFNITFSLLQRSHSQKTSLSATLSPAVIYLAGVWPLGIIVGLILPHHIIWSWWIALLLLFVAIFSALNNWLAFKAVKHLPVAQFQTIYQFYEIVVIALGSLLLGETLSKTEALGGALVLCAAILAIQAPRRKTQNAAKSATAVKLAVLGAMALGIQLIFEKASLGHMDIGAYLIFGYGAQTVGITAFASKEAKKLSFKLPWQELKRLLIMGIILGFTGVFYVAALVNSDNISLVTAVGAIALPLTALGAYAVLKEKENQRLLWTAVFLAFFGLIIAAL